MLCKHAGSHSRGNYTGRRRERATPLPVRRPDRGARGKKVAHRHLLLHRYQPARLNCHRLSVAIP